MCGFDLSRKNHDLLKFFECVLFSLSIKIPVFPGQLLGQSLIYKISFQLHFSFYFDCVITKLALRVTGSQKIITPYYLVQTHQVYSQQKKFSPKSPNYLNVKNNDKIVKILISFFSSWRTFGLSLLHWPTKQNFCINYILAKFHTLSIELKYLFTVCGAIRTWFVCVCALIRRAQENTVSHDSHLSISLAHGSRKLQKRPTVWRAHSENACAFCVDVCMCIHKCKVHLA